MALIIKGDMPTCCGACKSVQRYRYSDECEYLRKPIARNGRLKDCPILGEIPDKHGDMIDRGKASTQIIAEICQFCSSAAKGNCDGCLVQKCLDAVSRVPVVVEATE